MATTRQTYSEVLKRPDNEKKEPEFKAVELDLEPSKPGKGVRFDLETERFVTNDGAIVGDFAPKRTHPGSCLRPPATFPTFGATIKPHPPFFRQFSTFRRKAAPKSWRKQYLASRVSSSAAGVGSSATPSFDTFVSPKFQGNAVTRNEAGGERQASSISPTVAGDFKEGFVDLFASKPNIRGNTKDEANLKWQVIPTVFQ